MILTPFAALHSLSSSFLIEYIFDYNPTNSSFFFQITFLLVSLKEFESFE